MTDREFWLGGMFSRVDSLWLIGSGVAFGAGHTLAAFGLVVAGAVFSAVVEYACPEPPQ